MSETTEFPVLLLTTTAPGTGSPVSIFFTCPDKMHFPLFFGYILSPISYTLFTDIALESFPVKSEIPFSDDEESDFSEKNPSGSVFINPVPLRINREPLYTVRE